MKKLLVAALLVVGMTTFAQEQVKEQKAQLTPEQRVESQVKRMTKDLTLNEKQVQDVRAIVAKEVSKREENKAEMEARKAAGTKPSKEEMKARKAKFQEDEVAMDANMKKILTPEQYAKWNQKIQERKEKMEAKKAEKMKGN
ncbi:Spy/CpxP family protein refolding chaperone [Flavobacterium sp.]|jgi:Spy/CpxP family protein refolding chaperone|uniref:Spy/CpxP family protein refolding chaperone n=1 Tax=Flavobacterium sp. TaxID=239 RepID=UPI0037C125FE